ncbi:MAG: YegP family protein [Clostridia bacterium]|nr:YegP family protein [Clostridia bacterium]
MSIFSWLFGKKKAEEKDGQEEYFKDDFTPVIKRPARKKPEPIVAEPEAKSNEAQKDNVKKAAKTVKHHSRRVERKVVKPTPKSERIIKPSGTYNEIREDSPEVKGAVPVSESKATPSGRFEIEKAKDGRFFFTLYASNSNPIAYSQLYSSSSGATNGISSVIANSQKAGIEDTTLKNPTTLPCPKWEIYIDKAGEYRFRLYAPNGQCVCHSSHGYSTKSGCKGGMESIKRFSAEAKVDKAYLK